MIHEVKCVMATCDNCGERFEESHSGFTIFVDDGIINESMDSADWYTGADPDHEGKHYCPDCFKRHDDIDDKIIVDETRKKTAP